MRRLLSRTPLRRPRVRRGAGASIPRHHRPPPNNIRRRRLPPTKKTRALPGRPLAFTAAAGSIRLFDDKGEPQADIAYTAYQLDGSEPHSRPVTFLFNGGAGAASPHPHFWHA